MNPTQRAWTYQDEFILRRDFPKIPTAELARKLRRTEQAVSVKAAKLGLKKEHYGIVWTPQMLKLLHDYFPIMFDEPLAKMIGVSKRTLIRKARELGYEKPEDFIEKRRKDIARLASASLKRNGTGGANGLMKPGVHSYPAGEFKTGHKESEESKAKRIASLKEYYRRKRLLEKYGLR